MRVRIILSVQFRPFKDQHSLLFIQLSIQIAVRLTIVQQTLINIQKFLIQLAEMKYDV